MTKAASDLAHHSNQKALLKALAEEAALRAQRFQRVGLALCAVSVVILYFGLSGAPFSAFGFLLAIWAMRDAYAADEELRVLRERML